MAEMTPEAQAWFEKNKKSIVAKHEKYWPSWQQKPADQKAEVTMGAADAQ